MTYLEMMGDEMRGVAVLVRLPPREQIPRISESLPPVYFPLLPSSLLLSFSLSLSLSPRIRRADCSEAGLTNFQCPERRDTGMHYIWQGRPILPRVQTRYVSEYSCRDLHRSMFIKNKQGGSGGDSSTTNNGDGSGTTTTGGQSGGVASLNTVTSTSQSSGPGTSASLSSGSPTDNSSNPVSSGSAQTQSVLISMSFSYLSDLLSY